MRRILPAVAAALCLSNCGYVGDPLPPLANVPSPVTGLQVRQQGSRLLVQFTLPTLTTEGMTIKAPLRTDLRMGDSDMPGGAVRNGVAYYELPASDWSGRKVTISARVAGSNGKESAWTNRENVEVVSPPEQPTSVTAENAPLGVRLSWSGPPGTFRIHRREPDAKEFAVAATVDSTEWIDTAIAEGKPYAYFVERIVKLGGGGEATSEPSKTVVITPKDTFPPAAPSGLRAGSATGSAELSWARNTEPDLSGYRVYRAAADGTFEKIADVSIVPAYSDRAVESGKTYRYAVTAVDRAGNESARSSAVDVRMP